MRSVIEISVAGALMVLVSTLGLPFLLGCHPPAPEPVYVPRTAAVRALEAATAALAGGDIARARVKVAEAVAEAPDYYLAHGVQGMVLAETGDYAEALAAMERAVALEPSYGEGHLMRGVFLEQTGNRSEADAAYGEALRVFDANAKATPGQRTCRAVAVYLRDGKIEGIAAIDGVVREYPHFAIAATVRQKMLGENRAFFLRWATSTEQGGDGA